MASSIAADDALSAGRAQRCGRAERWLFVAFWYVFAHSRISGQFR
jgi:hypothetical protein